MFIRFRLCLSDSEVIKLFFMLNSAEREILNAHKYKNIKKFSFFHTQMSLQCYLLAF